MTKNGCSFGQVSREMITETRKDIAEIKISVNSVDEKITDLFNHQSSKLSNGATALIAFLASIVSALGIWALTR